MMTLRNEAALDAVAAYYEERVREHGPTPWGVDWTCEPTQQLRFIQLLKVVRGRGAFSLNDFGCGYGALLPFVRGRFPGVDYFGVDVSPRMIAAARRRDRDAAFDVSATLPRVADYSVASGVFNVQLGIAPLAWRTHVKDTLRELARASRLGFAVNFILPPGRGIEEPLQGLYRTRPATWAAFCADAFGAEVEIVRGYGLREFTLLARRPSAARRGASGRAPSSRTAP